MNLKSRINLSTIQAQRINDVLIRAEVTDAVALVNVKAMTIHGISTGVTPKRQR